MDPMMLCLSCIFCCIFIFIFLVKIYLNEQSNSVSFHLKFDFVNLPKLNCFFTSFVWLCLLIARFMFSKLQKDHYTLIIWEMYLVIYSGPHFLTEKDLD